MLKTEVRRRIFDALAPTLADAGFRRRPRAEGFVRAIDGGRQELNVALWDFRPTIEFSLVLCLRLDAVQAILHPHAGTDPRYHGITLTSITQLEHLGLIGEPGRGVLWRVTSEAELADALVAATAVVRERVLPFFDAHCDLASIHAALNPPGAERITEPVWPLDRRVFDSTNPPYGAIAAVAAASLVGDPRLPALVDAYRGQLRNLTEPDRAKFESIAAALVQ